MAKKRTETKKQTRQEELATLWSGRLEEAEKNQKTIFDEAKENYEIYYAKTNEKQKAASPWKSNVFLPFLPGKARDTKAKLSILEPRFQVRPADAWEVAPNGEMNFDQEALVRSLKVSKKLNKEFREFSPTGEQPPMAAMDFCRTDAIVAGWGLGLVPLSTYKRIYKTHPALKDGQGNDSAYVDMARTISKELLRVKTELIPLDIFRTWLSPRAKSWERPYWVITEREETYEGLSKKNGKKGEYIYNLPPELKTAKGSLQKNDYSAVREVSLGFQANAEDRKDESVNTFSVFDCYDAETNKFYTFVKAKLSGQTAKNDWHLIREMDNPYNHGLIPIVPFYTKRRPHSPWGESLFAIAKDAQYAFNAGFNQFRDNATLSGESMAIMDKNSLVDNYEVGPGKTIKYDSLNGEKPEPWKFPDPNPAVLSTQSELLQQAMESGTTPQYNSGQVSSNMDKTAGTRGGIEMLLEMANDKLSEMYRNLKSSMLRYGYIAMHNAQQYQNYIEVLDHPDMSATGQAAIRAGERTKVDYLAPVELQDAYDLDVDDESLLPLTKTERRKVFIDFINLLVELQKASSTQSEAFNTPDDFLRIDWGDVVKELGAQFGELNAPAFLKPMLTREQLAQKTVEDKMIEQEANNAAMQSATEADPEAEVTQDPNGISVQRQKRELANFKDYPADVKNAVLQSLGYPPSQLVAEQAKAQLAESQSQVLDTQVKQQMIEAARAGQLDPETLAKFVSK